MGLENPLVQATRNIQLAMSANLPYTAVHNLILTHPTLSEGFINLFNTVPKQPN